LDKEGPNQNYESSQNKNWINAGLLAFYYKMSAENAKNLKLTPRHNACVSPLNEFWAVLSQSLYIFPQSFVHNLVYSFEENIC
jgi:hypothetical protein